jgi:hypothetical protein
MRVRDRVSPRPPTENEDVSRASARLVLAVLFLAGFAMRATGYAVGLPFVFHSDGGQVDEATQVVTSGSFEWSSHYPPLNRFGYVASDLATFGIGRAFGVWPSWRAFVEDLVASPALAHSIARLYTALVGAFLAIAGYRLARSRFSRWVSLLASAFLAFSPAHVIYAHQGRPHVPAVTALVCAAVVSERAFRRPSSVGRAAVGGASCGAAAGALQLPIFLAVALALRLARDGESGRRLARVAAFAIGFAAALGGLAIASELAAPARDGTWVDSIWRPLSVGAAANPDLDPTGRVPDFLLRWVCAEPWVAAGIVVFGWRCLRVPGLRSSAVALGAYPVIVSIYLGSTAHTFPRHSLSLAPFLAPLAAHALAGVGPRGWIRAAVVASALSIPAASSVRYLAMLGAVDTRTAIRRAIEERTAESGKVVVESGLLDTAAIPRGAALFPPGGKFVQWRRKGIPGEDLLDRVDAPVLIRRWDSPPRSALSKLDVERIGYRLVGRIATSRWPHGTTPLPDAPDLVLPELWTSRFLGPPVEIFARTPEAGRELELALEAAGLFVEEVSETRRSATRSRPRASSRGSTGRAGRRTPPGVRSRASTWVGSLAGFPRGGGSSRPGCRVRRAG